jgi:hypothetical protein
MQKEFEKQETLKSLDDEHKQQVLKDMEDKEKKHKQHEPVSAVYAILNIYGRNLHHLLLTSFFAVYILAEIYFGVTCIGCRSHCLQGSLGDQQLHFFILAQLSPS